MISSKQTLAILRGWIWEYEESVFFKHFKEWNVDSLKI